ncbi:hypothetical protein HOV38_gp47 [Raoultella phage RP180]|uniref:Uncharacterized protein n=1 Tax=Raoultella phage RP180 TaxID=2565500 RepID=A0A4D6DYE4_9CAUD|nr:hypothetical protein HOV38_gp47 [Raoultella phage RP180]QBZ71302.1 hypothetical protein RP180_47 [Raoultella phage RP180]
MGVGMRIRIIDVDYVLPPGYGDHSLRYFGVSVGDEFEAITYNDYGCAVEHCGEELYVRRREYVILED